MGRKAAGAGGMPAEIGVKEVPLAQMQAASEQATDSEGARQEGSLGFETQSDAGSGSGFEAHPEGASDSVGRQPDFRVVQPEYNSTEGKTIFKDVGALWKNISRKTGREFYTMKIGKLKLLVFPNTKMNSE